MVTGSRSPASRSRRSQAALLLAYAQKGFDSAIIQSRNFVRWAATQPDLKIILTVRDKTKWARSIRSVSRIAFLTDQRPYVWLKFVQTIRPYFKDISLNHPTNGHPEKWDDIPTLEAGYDDYVSFVKETIPPERLLVFSVLDGWDPLCRFLEKPIPEEPFPHVNDRLVLNAIIVTLEAITWIWPLLLVSPFLLVTWVLSLIRRLVVPQRNKAKEL